VWRRRDEFWLGAESVTVWMRSDVTLRHVLTHQAGVPGLPLDLATEELCDWEYMWGLLAAAVPWWPAWTAFGYHAQTFGFLIGGILQRATACPSPSCCAISSSGPSA
jgi:CubicO group peptidase (beta-lactamase class C family)